MILQKCQHTFCFKCIFEKIDGKKSIDAQCPICLTTIEKDTFVESITTNKLIASLRYGCNKSCGKTFLISEVDIKEDHGKTCLLNSKATLKGIFTIKEASDIPDQVEKAALHVIKTKRDSNKIVSFKTGGWVRKINKI